MKCNEVQRQLVALADRELSDQPGLAEHVQNCPACRGLLAALQADAALLRQEEEPVVPDGLAVRVMARVRSDSSGRGDMTRVRPRIRYRVPRPMVAAALVLAAVGLWLGAMLGRGIVGQSRYRRERAVVFVCGMSAGSPWDNMIGE